ncbi:MAG: four helix bundle protein [Planctomycetota bacterium]|nr:four helix bundle protein [Planctomycetota bacterium]
MGNRITYRDLEAWKKAMDFVEQVYRLSAQFPESERFGLSAQLRRSALSIPSNIAEGQARATVADFKRMLYIARGSLAEAETQLLIAVRLEYIGRNALKPVWRQAQTVGRLLNGLLRALKD